MARYDTEEERIEAKRRSAKAYYERNKHDEKYKEMKKASQEAYCKNNREAINEKSKAYYHREKDYREKKIEQIKQRLIDEPDLKNIRNEQNKARYWINKTRMLEMEKILLESGHIRVSV